MATVALQKVDQEKSISTMSVKTGRSQSEFSKSSMNEKKYGLKRSLISASRDTNGDSSDPVNRIAKGF